MPFHHIQLVVSSEKEAKKFYVAALAPLGYTDVHSVEGVFSGLGVNGKPDFFLRGPKDGESPSKGVHIAFAAENREQVHQFYDAALKAGAKDNGGPGERDYFPGYYAAFVRDLDGNNVEVVHL
ncbi:glyoxalase/bleomycin resistance protein/dioxygenase [Gymnopilus junonius]|uniref:Glyoxalase/bleomycin resistance protein/dioxygenase n=1 Tax=Gymnopilus junonius TaxID=109634 RepID=A0A9P5TIM5_GYMJU|nr:glyoxalase/bleomycin resistance protein/dioxygenase [Gymnopilus junonius]